MKVILGRNTRGQKNLLSYPDARIGYSWALGLLFTIHSNLDMIMKNETWTGGLDVPARVSEPCTSVGAERGAERRKEARGERGGSRSV